jgi:8-oxo-dGTP pyrophosphatase MutT (NUDIX family)
MNGPETDHVPIDPGQHVPRGRKVAPRWLVALAEAAAEMVPTDPRHRLPAVGDARPAAVLVLFGDGPDGPDVLIIERAEDLRSHAGQPAFPGGAADPQDASRVHTALREAREEVGLDPAGVQVLGTTRPLYLPPSRYLVTPVLAWWHTPGPVAPVDPAETSAVARVPLAELADPANRLLLRHPRSTFASPAFRVRRMVVWGFTAGILDALLRLGGWERPWNREVAIDDPAVAASIERGRRASTLDVPPEWADRTHAPGGDGRYGR